MNDDDLSLEIIADRSSTPPTPCSSICHDKFMYTSSCDSYLQYIEPNPVYHLPMTHYHQVVVQDFQYRHHQFSLFRGNFVRE